MTISVPVLFSLSSFDIPFVAVLALFSYHFLSWQYPLFLKNLCDFFWYFWFVFCLLYYLYVYSHYIRLNWDGLFTKKEFIFSLSCVSGTIIFSKLNVRRFIEIKILPVYLQFLVIHYFDNCGLFVQKLSRCWSCLAVGFCCILVALLRALYQICKCFFFCFCLIYIHSGNIFSTVYFLFIRVSVSRIFWFTYWQPVFFKPLLFFLKTLVWT